MEAFRPQRPFEGLLLLFEERQTGLLVLRHFVTGGERVNRAFLRLTSEEVEGHLLAALEGLQARVKDVRFARFFALNTEGHMDGLGLLGG
jgi:hypothetical protein